MWKIDIAILTSFYNLIVIFYIEIYEIFTINQLF